MIFVWLDLLFGLSIRYLLRYLENRYKKIIETKKDTVKINIFSSIYGLIGNSEGDLFKKELTFSNPDKLALIL